MQHTISVLVKNETGILSRISNLFSSRGYKLDSITMANCIDEEYARATIVADGEENVIEQIKKQLNKLVPVINVADTNSNEHIYELVFIKVYTEDSAKLLDALKPFEFKILEISDNIYTIRVICEKNQFHSLNFLLKKFNIKDVVRSGSVAI